MARNAGGSRGTGGSRRSRALDAEDVSLQKKWLTSFGRATHCSIRAWSRCSGSGDPSVVKSDRCRMNRARMAVAVRQQREQLHPARVDSGERLVRGRGQAGDRPVMALGPARNGDAAFAVDPEDFENLVGVRTPQQLLEPVGIFEPQFEESVRSSMSSDSACCLRSSCAAAAASRNWRGPCILSSGNQLPRVHDARAGRAPA